MGYVVLDEGPIAHADLIRYADTDLELALEQSRYSAEAARYRLVEIDLADIEDTSWLSGKPREDIQAALERGESLPPIVVVQPGRVSQFGILDGVNRTGAHRSLGLSAIRAYELIVGEEVLVRP